LIYSPETRDYRQRGDLVSFQFEDFGGHSTGFDDFDLDTVSGVDVALCRRDEHIFNDRDRLFCGERSLGIATILMANLSSSSIVRRGGSVTTHQIVKNGHDEILS
jgi:hypothetical protein